MWNVENKKWPDKKSRSILRSQSVTKTTPSQEHFTPKRYGNKKLVFDRMGNMYFKSAKTVDAGESSGV